MRRAVYTSKGSNMKELADTIVKLLKGFAVANYE